MARALNPATELDVQRVRLALIKLREARDLLTAAGASQSAKAVRASIKSAEGAERHVVRRAMES